MSERKTIDLELELVRTAAALATKKEVDHLLFITDLPPTDDMIKVRSAARKKLVQAVTSESQQAVYETMGSTSLLLPAYDLPRHEKFKIALVAGLAQGVFKKGETVLALVARSAASYPDTLMLVTVEEEESGSTSFNVGGAARIPSQVMEAVLSIAMSVAEEGWEGHPLGSIFVIGDTTRVLEKSRQLTLNPFQGYSESDKNLYDPRVRDAIKNFAVLDGAFVIREDGVVLAAGRYLNFEPAELALPLGLGARHTAAAGITKDCDAVAVAVSQSSGVVRVFEKGRVVMRLEASRRRSWTTEEASVPSGEVPAPSEAPAAETDGKPKEKPRPKESKEPRDPKVKEPKKDAKDAKQDRAVPKEKEKAREKDKDPGLEKDTAREKA